jgi:hypothetical protein
MYHPHLSKVALFVLLASLSGCQTDPTLPVSASAAHHADSAKSEVMFMDIKKFDQDLYRALHTSEPEVKVVMYEKVSPNSTPDRLQKWLNAVEKNGGKVDIEPPPNELVPKNPLALIGLVGGLWDAVKAVTDFRDAEMTRAVKGRDAVISLERNARGEVVVSKLTFKKKAN